MLTIYPWPTPPSRVSIRHRIPNEFPYRGRLESAFFLTLEIPYIYKDTGHLGDQWMPSHELFRRGRARAGIILSTFYNSLHS
jgi:hypothetical protein